MNPSLGGSTSHLPFVRRRRSTFDQRPSGIQFIDCDFSTDDNEITTQEEENRRRSRLNRSLDDILQQLKDMDFLTKPDFNHKCHENPTEQSKPPMSPINPKPQMKVVTNSNGCTAEQNDIAHDVVLRKNTTALLNQNRGASNNRSKRATSSILDLPPDVKSLETSEFVQMLNTEWDVYKDKRNGRTFYHHSVSGDSRWKPPRQSSIPVAPISQQRTFNFDVKTHEDETDESQSNDAKSPIKDTDSYVRDSIRRSDQSDIEIPNGYIQIYDKSNGYISYYDPMLEIVWNTALDTDNNMYFFTSGGPSSWKLPPIPSLISAGNTPTKPKLEIMRSGWLEHKGPQGQPKKSTWCKQFVALVDGHLLFFKDQRSYEQIWIPTVTGELHKAKKQSGGNLLKTDKQVELNSDLEKISPKVKLRFKHNDEAINWFQDLSRYVKNTVRSTGTPHFGRKKSFSTELPSSVSVPASPLFPSRAEKSNRNLEPQLPSSNIELTKSNTSLGWKGSFRSTKAKFAGVISSRPKNPSKTETDHFVTVPDSDSLSLKAVEPKKPKLKREGSLLKSFRSNNKMDDTVKLRVKKTKLERTPSKQNKINYLTAFIGNSRDSKRQSRESLVERGIIKPASVFGNSLSNMKPDPTTGLPEFLVRATQRIEEFADTVGIYRVNGDGAIVQKIRLEVDNDNYGTFDSTNDAALLASSLKLFFRELQSFIITKEVCQAIATCVEMEDKATMIPIIQKAIECGGLDMTAQKVLAHLMSHLNRLSKMPENKMDAKNLAVVFSPNLVENNVGQRKHESIMSQLHLNNLVVELLITHAPDIFAYIHK